MEKHHIIPKSLGSSNMPENLVWLSATDHFRCHQLLVEITEDAAKGKMCSGLWRMMNKQSRNQNRDYTFSAEEYEEARINHAKNHSIRMSGKRNPFYGKSHTTDTRKRMSEAKKGKTYEEIYGKKQADAMRRSRAEANKRRTYTKQEKVTCPHCNTTGGKGVMNRWHFDRCKNIV